MGRKAGQREWPLDDEWRAEIRRKMKERNIDESELGRLIGTHQSNVNRMLKPGGSQSSSYAPRVAEMFGVPLPQPIGQPAAPQENSGTEEFLEYAKRQWPMIYEKYVRELRERIQEHEAMLAAKQDGEKKK